MPITVRSGLILVPAAIALTQSLPPPRSARRTGRGSACPRGAACRSAPPRVADVVGDRAPEDERILQDDGDRAAQRCEGDVANVGAVDQHRAARGVVEP